MKYKLLIILVVMVSCGKQSSQENTDSTDISTEEEVVSYPTLLQNALKSHGGLQQWQAFNSLQYDVKTTLGSEKTETQLIDLKSRKVLITGSNYTLGMDGSNVWVSPDKATFGDMPPRFYHNLIFYFFAVPFVLSDPGIQYEDLGERSVAGQNYRALKISFKEGVGDADDDLYIAHFNPDTYQLELLLYTVTYFSGEKHENYNALRYTDWQKVNGLLVPAVMEGYKFQSDSIGELRYRAEFSNVVFSEEVPDQALFDMPENAEIDSLKTP
ncbi:DUF6503 family protein [Fulvivirga ulvae]|uniref:DUF6503 family protein n=1 Tax=Fulvivirga ulvae TaxID=2904245 RepID=UPI001F379594|nr:DUF6503 family protein [Fulvivirga ulvae]UII31331.1 DUF6503 family protein [Fulvivirga ulvae]